MTDDEIPEGYEYAEVSAAKNIALAVLEEADLPEDADRIGIADKIVTDLIAAGVSIPQSLPDPFAMA